MKDKLEDKIEELKKAESDIQSKQNEIDSTKNEYDEKVKNL